MKYLIKKWYPRSKYPLIPLLLCCLAAYPVSEAALAQDTTIPIIRSEPNSGLSLSPVTKVPELLPSTTNTGQPAHDHVNIPQSLDLAIRQALSHRLDIPIEQANITARQSSVGEAKGRFWPTLDLKTSTRNITQYDTYAGFNVNATFNGQTLPVRVERDVKDNVATVETEVEWNLYNGGRDSARLTEAKAEERGAYAKLRIKQKDIVLEVVNAYINLAKSLIQNAIAKREADFAREKVKIANIKFQEDRISEIEKDEVKLHADEKEIAQLKSFQKLKHKLNKYLISIGMDSKTGRISLDYLSPIGNDVTNLNSEYLVRTFIPEKNQILAMALAQVEAARANHRATKADYLPKIDFSVSSLSIGRSEESQNDAFSDIHKDSDIVKLEIKWNLFDGFRTSQRVSRAHANQIKSQLELEQKRIALYKEKNDKDITLRITLDALSIAEKELSLTKHRGLIDRKKLEMNKISTMDYKASIIVQENAEANLTMAKFDVTLAELEYITISLDAPQQEQQ